MDEDSEDWNMAKAYYMRLDEILTICTMSQMKGNGLEWYKALYRLYVEIQAKMKPKQKKAAKKMLDELTKWKMGALKTKQTISTKKFVEFELYLRQVLEDKHMLTPRKDISGL